MTSVLDDRSGREGRRQGIPGTALSLPVLPTVGAPIRVQRSPRPSRAQVDTLHALYVERLTRLFEEHKERYGVPADQHLVLT